MNTENLTRVDRAVVNNDFAAYQAALARRKSNQHTRSLEERINNLEIVVKRLEKTLEEIIK